MKISKLMLAIPSNIKDRNEKDHLYITTMLEIDKITRDFRIKMKNKIIK